MIQPDAGTNEDVVVAGGWRLEHSYAELPAGLHTAVEPTAVRAPRMVVWNQRLAQELGLGSAGGAGAEAVEIFAGNRLPPRAAPP